ncbi:MAG: hypothetical protein SGJ05_09935 [bacterium]|nr:hypothetical protein [bacterium]
MAIIACDDGVLNFPQPAPASVRVVNVTQDVTLLGVGIEGETKLLIARGSVSSVIEVPAGRQVSFVFLDSNKMIGRDTLRYTFGGDARVILFAKGTKTNLVEIRQAIQDTIVTSSSMAFVRFTHMVENFDKAGFVELWHESGSLVFDDLFQPGFSSRGYTQLAPGTYSFVLREEGTSLVLGRLTNVSLAAGMSYMIYSYDAAPPAVDSIAMGIFN